MCVLNNLLMKLAHGKEGLVTSSTISYLYAPTLQTTQILLLHFYALVWILYTKRISHLGQYKAAQNLAIVDKYSASCLKFIA